MTVSASTDPVIPDMIRNPQLEATGRLLEPWILNARRKYPWVRVQDDRLSVIPGSTRNPGLEATERFFAPWILGACRNTLGVQAQDDCTYQYVDRKRAKGEKR